MLLDMIFTEGGYRIIRRIDIPVKRNKKVIIQTNYSLGDFDFSSNQTVHFFSTADIIFFTSSHHYEKIVSLAVKFID
jgi:hypothetical protein